MSVIMAILRQLVFIYNSGHYGLHLDLKDAILFLLCLSFLQVHFAYDIIGVKR